MSIKKGDKVQVITGSDKGTVGEVKAVLTASHRVIVEGVNIRKKHQKPTQMNPDGGIVDMECPIHVSNVKLSTGKSKKKTSDKKVDKKKEDTKKKTADKKADTKKKGGKK